MLKNQTCEKCRGTKQIRGSGLIYRECSTCGGTGLATKKKEEQQIEQQAEAPTEVLSVVTKRRGRPKKIQEQG